MKIAIMNYGGKSPNRGGPIGYLNNLYSNEDNIEQLPDFLFVENFQTPNNPKNLSENKSLRNRMVICLRDFAYFLLLGIRCKKKLKKIVNGYDVVHVHSSQDAYYLKYFCKYKGYIILTSHRPEPYLEEGRPILNNSRELIYKPLKKFYFDMEKKSYKVADGFIFPSPGAKEIYNKFPGFIEGSKDKPIEYVYTGINKKEITISREDYRKNHNISLDKFVITFIGRHTEIKGYDRLVKAYPELKKHEIEVVVAGAESSIQHPDDEGWKELGYINDAQNLMNASDVVVIPNRNTYYDLVIVEALSTGSVVISSDTGGNIDISQKTDGLILFDNTNEKTFIDKILYAKNMSKDEFARREKSALDFYNEYGNNKKFVENYLKAMKKICNKFEKR